MNADSIIYLLDELGSPRTKVTGENVMAGCPLAPWTHDKGYDSGHKLGVKITDGVSPAHCFYPGCHSGTLLSLVSAVAAKKAKDGEPGWEVGGEKTADLKGYLLMAEEDDLLRAPAAITERQVAPIPQDIAAAVGGGSPYWAGRGFSPAISTLLQLGEAKGRALIPWLDAKGQVYAVNGRLLPDTAMDEMPGSLDARTAKYRAWPLGFPKKLLYGQHLLTKPVEWLVVVESEADAGLLNAWFQEDARFRDSVFPWKQATQGAAAVATGGGEFSADQVQRIVEALAPTGEVAVAFDSDHAGRYATRKLVDRLVKRLPRVTEVEWLGKDASDDAGGKYTLAQVQDRALQALGAREEWVLRRMRAAFLRTG